MLSKLQKLREEREQGFTLIELLVVILIIGILAAIAIPAFLNQRKSAVDSSVEADAKNIATAVETMSVKLKGQQGIIRYVDSTKTLDIVGVAGTAEKISLSNNSSLLFTDSIVNDKNDTSGYTFMITNPGGDRSATSEGIVYNSSAGGLQN